MEKKSFLIYRDNAPMIRMLSKEEAGELFLTLLDYADAVDEDLPPQQFMEGRTLPRAVELVFGFVASNVYRDNIAWRKTKAAKEAKRAQPAPEPRRVEPLDPPRASPFPRTYY